jgi:uncharacterized protein (DUF849 family)
VKLSGSKVLEICRPYPQIPRLPNRSFPQGTLIDSFDVRKALNHTPDATSCTMSLTDLAQEILTNAKMLDERGLVDPESKLGFRNLSSTDYNIRSRLIDAIQELNRLSLGPAEYLYSLYMTGVRIYELLICDHS